MKPIFLTLFISLFAFAVQAQSPEKAENKAAWLNGTWEGEKYQVNADKGWKTILVIDQKQGIFTIEYPELGCKGTLQPVKITDEKTEFIEKIAEGPCVDGGYIIITPTHENLISFSCLRENQRLASYMTMSRQSKPGQEEKTTLFGQDFGGLTDFYDSTTNKTSLSKNFYSQLKTLLETPFDNLRGADWGSETNDKTRDNYQYYECTKPLDGFNTRLVYQTSGATTKVFRFLEGYIDADAENPQLFDEIRKEVNKLEKDLYATVNDQILLHTFYDENALKQFEISTTKGMAFFYLNPDNSIDIMIDYFK